MQLRIKKHYKYRLLSLLTLFSTKKYRNSLFQPKAVSGIHNKCTLFLSIKSKNVKKIQPISRCSSKYCESFPQFHRSFEYCLTTNGIKHQ